jgi:hypothetical protein
LCGCAYIHTLMHTRALSLSPSLFKAPRKKSSYNNLKQKLGTAEIKDGSTWVKITIATKTFIRSICNLSASRYSWLYCSVTTLYCPIYTCYSFLKKADRCVYLLLYNNSETITGTQKGMYCITASTETCLKHPNGGGGGNYKEHTWYYKYSKTEASTINILVKFITSTF